MIRLLHKKKYDNYTDKIPKWYKNNMTYEEIVKNFGSTSEANKFLKAHNLISPIFGLIRKIPIWYDENKTIKQMAKDGNVTYNSARSYMKEFRLPHVDARIGATHRVRKPTPPSWYDPNLTIDEMAKNSGRSYRATHIQLQRLAKRGLVLPYKRNTHDQVVAKFIQLSNENRRRARLRCDEEIARARKEDAR